MLYLYEKSHATLQSAFGKCSRVHLGGKTETPEWNINNFKY